jgi:hypothetical protein
VSPVRPSPEVIAKVEAVSVALAQPEGDVSSAGMPEPQKARVESLAPRGTQSKASA